MPCAQAAGVARGALFRLGYPAEVVEKPAPGRPGTVIGRREAGWATATPEPGAVYTATVTVSCSNDGAAFAALTDEPWPRSLSFAADFAAAVATVAARKVSRPQLAERPATGLVIEVEPLRGSAAVAALGADLPAAGITPVRLTIENRTDRTYEFAAARVTLVTQENARQAPLGPADTGHLAPAMQSALREAEIADGSVPPRAVQRGFLYFPAFAYRRATLVLIDTLSDEEEGFSVEFD